MIFIIRIIRIIRIRAFLIIVSLVVAWLAYYFIAIPIRNPSLISRAVASHSLPLIPYPSPSFKTDPHQRPLVSFTSTPLAPFAGDTINFDAGSSQVRSGTAFVFVTSGVTANAILRWIAQAVTLSSSSGITTSAVYPSSGIFNISLSVTDQAGSVCFGPTGSSEVCLCALTKPAAVNISRPKPFFREIKP